MGIRWYIFLFDVYKRRTAICRLPFVVGGLTITGAVLGVVLLNEPINFLRILSVVVLFVGLVILSRT